MAANQAGNTGMRRINRENIELIIGFGAILSAFTIGWFLGQERQSKPPPIKVHASTFGVLPDGTDQTEKLQIAINVMSQLGGSLIFDDGIYVLGSATGQLNYIMSPLATNILHHTGSPLRLRDHAYDHNP